MGGVVLAPRAAYMDLCPPSHLVSSAVRMLGLRHVPSQGAASHSGPQATLILTEHLALTGWGSVQNQQ